MCLYVRMFNKKIYLLFWGFSGVLGQFKDQNILKELIEKFLDLGGMGGLVQRIGMITENILRIKGFCINTTYFEQSETIVIIWI